MMIRRLRQTKTSPLLSGLMAAILIFAACTARVGADTPPTSEPVEMPAAAEKQEETPVAAAYTGVVIDARHLPTICRSPSPALYGPAPEHELVYPDRAHVPTPDEVQEQSIVRYYHNEEQARKGFVGENPLILKAVEVVGPAEDSLRLTAEDRAKLRELDKEIAFTRSWKVGFLVPEGE